MPEHLSIGDEVVLTVRAQDGQYHLNATPSHSNPWPEPVDALFTGEDDWIAFITGTAYGPVSVHVHYLSHMPAEVAEGWDMIGERDLICASGRPPTIWGPDLTIIQEIYGDVVATLAMPPDRYRVRIHVANRQQAHQGNDPTKKVERHLIQLWSTKEAVPPAILTGQDTYARHYSATTPNG